jgi:hypothetical protein
MKSAPPSSRTERELRSHGTTPIACVPGTRGNDTASLESDADVMLPAYRVRILRAE